MSKPLHSAAYSLFIEELRAARDRAGVSQKELAALIGEDQTFVSKCERGVRRLDVVELKRWTDALGVGLIEFVTLLDHRLDRNQALKQLRRPKATLNKSLFSTNSGDGLRRAEFRRFRRKLFEHGAHFRSVGSWFS